MGFFSEMAGEIGKIRAEDKRRENGNSVYQHWKGQHEKFQEQGDETYKKIYERERNIHLNAKMIANIDEAFAIIDTGIPGSREFSLLEHLSEEYRNTDYYKQKIYETLNLTYKEALDGYFDDECGIATMLYVMQDLLCFDEIKEDLAYSLKHSKYFIDEKKDIASVLIEEDIDKQLADIKNRYDFDSKLEREYFKNSRLDGRKLYDEGKYQEAFNKIVNADKDITYFDELKKSLLYQGLQCSETAYETTLYDIMLDLNLSTFKAIKYTKKNNEDTVVLVKTVDVIIAESLKYKQANLIDNINEELSIFLNDYAHWNDVESNQYEILVAFYASQKMYMQEKMVLEAMVNNNVPRTDEQEKRLAFLRNNSGNNNVTGVSIETTRETDTLAYEYRFLSWNQNQIKAYVDMHSTEGKIVSTPIVIEEWSDCLETASIKWDVEKLSTYLCEGLKEMFDDKYSVNVLESGAIINGTVDATASVEIKENIGGGGTYPWLHFVLTGEQITKKQITFAIYIIYMPNEEQRINGTCYDVNEQILSKLNIFKLKQSPRINNYIMTMKNVLIDELQKWLNTSNTADIY